MTTLATLRRVVTARYSRMFAAAVLGIVIIARTSAASLQVREHDPDWVSPRKAATKPNPLANRPETAAGGHKLFRQRCSTCHGDDARGGPDAPDLTQDSVRTQSDGALFWKISTGNVYHGMPTFSFLPEAQRWQLVLHLRSVAER